MDDDANNEPDYVDDKVGTRLECGVSALEPH